MTIPQGSVVKVRLVEGFSGEEGGVDMFGTTDFDGQSRYGEIPMQADASFAADVPANVPLHIQLVDKFGMATQVSGSHGTAAGTPVANEDIWFSGRSGESRFCGGCHENRTAPSSIAPGQTEAVVHGPVNLDAPRAQRAVDHRVRPRRQRKPAGRHQRGQRRATTGSAASPGIWPSSRSSTSTASAATTGAPARRTRATRSPT